MNEELEFDDLLFSILFLLIQSLDTHLELGDWSGSSFLSLTSLLDVQVTIALFSCSFVEQLVSTNDHTFCDQRDNNFIYSGSLSVNW
jgi:hypothetical protein